MICSQTTYLHPNTVSYALEFGFNSFPPNQLSLKHNGSLPPYPPFPGEKNHCYLSLIAPNICLISRNIIAPNICISDIFRQFDCLCHVLLPLARRRRRPEGEGANIDRRLVPYHAQCMRIQSHIEFIYLYIYIYASTVVLMRAALEFWPW